MQVYDCYHCYALLSAATFHFNTSNNDYIYLLTTFSHFPTYDSMNANKGHILQI